MLSGQSDPYRKVGSITCWMVFVLGVVYAGVTLFGFLSLKSPDEPIGDPFFTVMEILTILLSTLMAISMGVVHRYASPEDKFFSLTALLFMVAMATITSCVHFVILSMSHAVNSARIAEWSFFFSFRWPSVGYALDILAWDWFFALAMLFAAFVFKTGRLEKRIRTLMLIAGLLSLAGLLGVLLNNMQIRNIGIIGYAVLGPVVFLLIGIVFRHKAPPGVKDSRY